MQGNRLRECILVTSATRASAPSPQAQVTGIAWIESDGEDRTRLFVAAPDGRDARALATLPGRACPPSWSPDGKRFAVAAGRGGEAALFVVGLDGAPPRQVAGEGALWPAWRPAPRR